MLPFFKVLKGLIGIDVSHFVDFYGNCDYYSFRHYDHLMLEKKYARTSTNTLFPSKSRVLKYFACGHSYCILYFKFKVKKFMGKSLFHFIELFFF